MPTYPLDFPTSPGLTSARVSLLRATGVNRSPYTGKTQSLEGAFALWNFEGVVPECDGSEARDWIVFLTQLHGRAGTFKMPIPGYTGPTTGYAGDAGLVNGGSQTGLTLVTDGWDNGADVFNKGDWFTINDELKLVTSSASADGSGNLTIDFEPALRASPDNETAIEFADPFCIVSLLSDDNGWDIRAPLLHSFQFKAVEKF